MNTTVAERSASVRRWAISSALVDRVEAGRRLVEEEHVRIGEQLGGDAGPLALPPLSAPTRTSVCSVRPTVAIAARTAPSISAAVVDDGSRSRAA